MNVNIEHLKNYLTEHPQKYAYEDIHGLVDVLFWDYFENNAITNETVREGMKEAEEHMEKLTDEEIDRVFDDLFRVCIGYQRLSFAAGVQVGARLTLELTQE